MEDGTRLPHSHTILSDYRTIQDLTSLAIFNNMLASQVQPINLTFPSLIKQLALTTLFIILPYVANLLGSDFLGSILGEVGDLRGSRKMFDDIGHPCVIAGNSMLDMPVEEMERWIPRSSYFRECLKLMLCLGLLLSTGLVRTGYTQNLVMTFGEMIENERVVIRIISLVYFLCVLIWIKEVFNWEGRFMDML